MFKALGRLCAGQPQQNVPDSLDDFQGDINEALNEAFRSEDGTQPMTKVLTELEIIYPKDPMFYLCQFGNYKEYCDEKKKEFYLHESVELYPLYGFLNFFGLNDLKYYQEVSDKIYEIRFSDGVKIPKVQHGIVKDKFHNKILKTPITLRTKFDVWYAEDKGVECTMDLHLVYQECTAMNKNYYHMPLLVYSKDFDNHYGDRQCPWYNRDAHRHLLQNDDFLQRVSRYFQKTVKSRRNGYKFLFEEQEALSHAAGTPVNEQNFDYLVKQESDVSSKVSEEKETEEPSRSSTVESAIIASNIHAAFQDPASESHKTNESSPIPSLKPKISESSRGSMDLDKLFKADVTQIVKPKMPDLLSEHSSLSQSTNMGIPFLQDFETMPALDPSDAGESKFETD